VKPVGKPDAGNPHVRFDERGWETEPSRDRAHPRLYQAAVYSIRDTRPFAVSTFLHTSLPIPSVVENNYIIYLFMNMWKNMMDISMVAEYPQQNSGKLEPGRRGAPFEDKFQQAIRMYQSPWGIIYAAIVRPADPKSQIPVVLAQGWSENMKVLKESIKQLYAANRIVIALDHPRRGGAIDVHPSYPIEELRKALTIHEIIQQQDILLVDFIAHS
jgi:hypothetical protein